MLRSLIGVLLRFQNNRITIVADVEIMFHHVRVKPSDCDSLRFLWAEINEKTSKVVTYQMLVHVFGATDSPCYAKFPVKTIARDNIENYSAMKIETVLRSFYVEDLLKLVTSEQETASLIKDKVDLIKSGGFRITKFVSNNEHVMKSNRKGQIIARYKL